MESAGDAVDVLRREAADAWNPSSKTDQEYSRDIDRAADLLESLGNPPETVEGLQKRVEALAPDVHVLSDGDGSFHIDSGDLLMTAVHASPKQVRAAWFAIVGMMEVGRG